MDGRDHLIVSTIDEDSHVDPDGRYNTMEGERKIDVKSFINIFMQDSLNMSQI